MSNAEANQVKLIHASAVANIAITNAHSPVSRWPSSTLVAR